MASVSDEAFWDSFRYRPMSELDRVLASRMSEVFIDVFGEAALLTRPDREAIEAQLELEVGSNVEGHQAIQVGFLFAGTRPACEWDGTSGAAESLVVEMARNIAEMLNSDPHEDEDWRAAFERRS
jgi:hypothetical protein